MITLKERPSCLTLVSLGLIGELWLNISDTTVSRYSSSLQIQCPQSFIFKMEQFEMSLQPSVAMVQDWLASSNNTALSLEMIIAGLESLGRQDVISVIREEAGSAGQEAQVFISYQWDTQAEVVRIRQFLEEANISCWMDIGQMGGGDGLYQRVYTGLANCRAVLACLSPKFLISDWCVKELLLADLLKKPIIPVMVTRTVWPPPGPLALVLAPLVYTDLAGAGGHGGEGRHADSLARLHGLALRLQPLVTDPGLGHAHCPSHSLGPGPGSLKETYFYETEVLGAVGQEPIDQVPGPGTPLTSLAPTPLPALYPSYQSGHTQLSEDLTQRRGLLRLCECPGVLGVCNLL